MEQNIDRTVNVLDSQTNEALATATAKLIEMTYEDDNGLPGRNHVLLVLGPDGNTGYLLLSTLSLSRNGELPPEQQQAYDSFGLVAPTNSSGSLQTNPGPMTSSPPQQQQPPSPSTPQLVL